MPLFHVKLNFATSSLNIIAATADEAAEQAIAIAQTRLAEQGIKSIEIVPPEKHWTHPLDN